MSLLPATKPRSSIKGNRGKARIRRQVHRIAIVLATCAAIIALYELSGKGSSKRKHIRRKEHLKHDPIQRRHDQINYAGLAEREMISLVVSGKVHLVNIRISRSGVEEADDGSGSYAGVRGVFCQLNWALHKSDPSSYPMFHDLVDHSDCQEPFELDLKKVMKQVRTYDENPTDPSVHAIEPNGFVFHESRCGSTLVANSLAAMEPSKNRVYSESAPPIMAAKACGVDGDDCPSKTGVKLLQDVIYLMGRTDDYSETQLFFKIQSIGSKYIRIFNEAFPETPWIYVYREPVQILMSQLAQGAHRANCVHQLKDVPKHRIHELRKHGKNLHDLIPEEKCALHLSLLLEPVSIAFEEVGMIGRPVNYENLVEKLVDHIIPEHFRILMTNQVRDNIMEISSNYSKGRGGRKKEWKEDSQEKEKNASPEIRDASELFLQKWYEIFEGLSKQSYYGESD
mmetsp:Transcript_2589/g.3882  ORF Transcript_2589/g.3882 Transcript_2589/m.3882 type:complete len:454 (+) Transcript_2589:45-1406(+)